jgi:methyl-accepting chemotaxis protein
MFSFRISFKLVLIIAISLSGMMIMGPVALSTMRGQMMADRQAKTRQMIDVSYGIVAHYHQLESDGKLSREQAQAAAMGEIRDLRYDKVEYFFVFIFDIAIGWHPLPYR